MTKYRERGSKACLHGGKYLRIAIAKNADEEVVNQMKIKIWSIITLDCPY
jgi:hypothetical protein